MNSMLENLNSEQQLAVITTEGPLLVLSGAGTGKTRVLTTRIAYILAKELCNPWNILALTFTNKAANEMKNRIRDYSAGKWNSLDIWCGTFHAICLRILRYNATFLNIRSDFLIFGEEDQKSILKTILKDNGYIKDSPGEWVEKISRIKDAGIQEYDNISDTKTNKILTEYNLELKRLGGMDFADIILNTLKLFDLYPEILKKYQIQFKYILVDEFQDTNIAQMQLIRKLTTGTSDPNICCVGDDDQSIYSWRGAEIKNILDFKKYFPNTQIVRLETNYRSTPNILGAANSLIKHNHGRLGKELRSCYSASGDKIIILTVPTDLDEARIITDYIFRISNNNFGQFAILIRAGGLSRLFEEEFATHAIPYKLIGTTKFYDRMEIRDAIAYLRLLVYPFDDISFLRIISKPRRGFGNVALNKIRACGDSYMNGLHLCVLNSKLKDAANDFLNSFSFDWNQMKPAMAAQLLLEQTGYLKMWRESKDSDASDRLDNLKELITNVISKYDSLQDFLEHAALMMTEDNDSLEASDNNFVSIMTIHAAKGLEFDNVFLPAWEDGVFPNDKSVQNADLEEERRLAYVAITRAKKRVIISNAMSRMMYGQRHYFPISRFVNEIDKQYLYMQGNLYNPYANKIQNVKRIVPKKLNSTMVGQLITHEEFGHGTVIAQEGDILTIAFGNKGLKKIAKPYVKLL